MKRRLRIPLRVKFLGALLLLVTAVVSVITFTMANMFCGYCCIVYTMRGEFAKRRELIAGALARMPGVSCPLPDGAFYVFPDFRALAAMPQVGPRLGVGGERGFSAALAAHLLEQGHRDLAHTVLLEAENLQNKHTFSLAGEKEIKYATRALFMQEGDVLA